MGKERDELGMGIGWEWEGMSKGWDGKGKG